MNQAMPSSADTDMIICLIGFKRQVICSPFGFNLLSKEDASL